MLKGLNDGMKERLHHILNESKQHPVDEVYTDFIAVKNQYENIFTPEGLKVIREYISESIEQLKKLEGYEVMTKALTDELQSIEKDIDNCRPYKNCCMIILMYSRMLCKIMRKDA